MQRAGNGSVHSSIVSLLYTPHQLVPRDHAPAAMRSLRSVNDDFTLRRRTTVVSISEQHAPLWWLPRFHDSDIPWHTTTGTQNKLTDNVRVRFRSLLGMDIELLAPPPRQQSRGRSILFYRCPFFILFFILISLKFIRGLFGCRPSDCAFAVAAATTWNRLPPKVRTAEQFSRALKTHLFILDWYHGSPRRLCLVIFTDELWRCIQIDWLIDWLIEARNDWRDERPQVTMHRSHLF